MKIAKLPMRNGLILFMLCIAACGYAQSGKAPATKPATANYNLTKEQWRKRLTADEYAVMFEEATEKPFTGKYLDNHKHGTYLCRACGETLFASETKFNSGTGWPSFYQPIKGHIAEKKDESFGSVRTEVHCARCGAHMGHVFEDGPEPTGLRYCINSVSLNFKEEKKEEKK